MSDILAHFGLRCGNVLMLVFNMLVLNSPVYMGKAGPSSSRTVRNSLFQPLLLCSRQDFPFVSSTI